MRRSAAWASGVGLLTLAVFWPARRFPFLDWDDQANLVANAAYRGLSVRSLAWMATTHYRGPYQPLSWLSWSLDHALWGLDATAFHRGNLAWHALAAVLLFSVARRLLRQDAAAAAAALAFSIHPLRVESVAWATERRDVLCGAFFLAALGAYLRAADGGSRRRAWLLGSLLAFALALLAKGTAVGLPWALLAADVGALGRLPLEIGRWRRPEHRAVLLEKTPFFALSLAAGAMNLLGFRTGDLSAHRYSLSARLLLALHAAAFYAWKTAWPAGLSPYYELPADLSAAALPMAVGAAAAIAATVWLFLRRRTLIAAWSGWACYLLVLAPVSGLAQSGQQMAADRYSYLCGLPFALLAGAGWIRISGVIGRRAARAAGLTALCALALATRRQLACWRDDVSLWRRAVSVDPRGYLARSNLATALLRRGDDAGALREYEAALALRPSDVSALLNCGTILEKRGDFGGARRRYEAILALEPRNAEARNNLAGVIARSGRWQEAAALLEAALVDQPNLAQARFNLGVLLALHGHRREGQEQLRRAFALDPALAARLPRGL